MKMMTFTKKLSKDNNTECLNSALTTITRMPETAGDAGLFGWGQSCLLVSPVVIGLVIDLIFIISGNIFEKTQIFRFRFSSLFWQLKKSTIKLILFVSDLKCHFKMVSRILNFVLFLNLGELDF